MSVIAAAIFGPQHTERVMESDAHLIETKITELRELMRCTLDRTALPLMREQLMAEILKLNVLVGA